jgi:hypothetical protein
MSGVECFNEKCKIYCDMINSANALIGIYGNQQQYKVISVTVSQTAMFMSVLPWLRSHLTSVKLVWGSRL